MPTPTKEDAPLQVSNDAPVSKFGADSDFAKVLDFIQQLISNEFLRPEFDVPHLVVVGRQNVAKTTLINRLIGRYLLPMRGSESANDPSALTTYPIILSLRPNDVNHVRVSCETMPKICASEENPTDARVEHFLKWISQELPKVADTVISKIPVTVTLEGPGMSNLTLVDLPGVHFSNSDNAAMNLVTQELALEYIEKNKKSIIVIVTDCGDPLEDFAINLVMKRAPEYKHRTICVLAKPDKIRVNDETGRKIATNQSGFQLEADQFILLRGKDSTDPVERDWDAQMTRVKESEWFTSHPMYKDLQHVCGIDRLMETMISLLTSKMILEIPRLIETMRERRDLIKRELLELETLAVPKSLDGKGALLQKLQRKIDEKLKVLLFQNNMNKPGGEKVREGFQKFQTEILQVDPIFGKKDSDIITLQRRLEGVRAPLGLSSENSSVLQELMFKQFHHTLTNKIEESPVDKVRPVCERLVDSVETGLKDVVLQVIRECLAPFSTLKDAVEVKVVQEIFSKKKQQTLRFIHQYIDMQQQSVDIVGVTIPPPDELHTAIGHAGVENFKFPINRALTELKICSEILHPQTTRDAISLNTSYGMRNQSDDYHRSNTSSYETNCSGYKPPVNEMKATDFLNSQSVNQIKRNVVKCFNVIKMNMANTVPRAVQHFFIDQLLQEMGKPLEDHKELVLYLKEAKEVEEKRKRCRAQYEALEELLPQTDAVIQKLLLIKTKL